MASIDAGNFGQTLATSSYKPITTENAVFIFTAATGIASGVGNYIASQRLSDVDGDTIDLVQMLPVLVVTLFVTAIIAKIFTPNNQNWPVSEVPRR